MNRRGFTLLAGAILVLSGSSLLARAGWIKAKGALGERLIERALEATLRDGRERAPWSWADMHPVARLVVPRLSIERPVLSNASGPALAFGIGHVDGTSAPGGPGNCVLAGHRDSWAAFLADLKADDIVELETPRGLATYRVSGTAVVRFDRSSVLDDDGIDRLTLVTCWPFRGLVRSPWRYVVHAERIALQATGT